MRRPFAPLTVALVLLAASFAVPASAGAAIKLDPCGSRTTCGFLKVPLDRTGTVPGTVKLWVNRVRAKRTGGAPVFAFAGGPGQAASPIVQGFADDLGSALATRDLIVFDQRGTGQSGAIDCPAIQKDATDLAGQTACADKLGAKRPFYTTADSVQDIEAVRAALGVPKITLFGVSYGTDVAMSYALRYPSRVDRLVLDSVVPPAVWLKPSSLLLPLLIV